MFCEHCGSQIPDGSKFCTECGSPVSAPEAPAPEPVSEFIPTGISEPVSEFIPTGIPVPATDFISTGVPEPVTDFIPTGIPEPEPVAAPEPEAYSVPTLEPEPDTYSAPEPAAYSVPGPDAPAAPGSSAGNPFGYSEIGSGAAASYTPRPAAPQAPAEKKPITKQWWFWAAIAVVAVILVVVLLASLFRANKKPVTAESSVSSVSIRDSLASHADAAPEETTPAEEPAPAEEPQTGIASLDDFYAHLNDYAANRFGSQGYSYFTERYDDYGEDGDTWFELYLWKDDTLSIAEDAFAGNSEATVLWNAMLGEIIAADAELDILLESSGFGGSDVCVNLVDQQDYEYLLAFAVEGELQYDQVSGIDYWGVEYE